MPIELIVYLCGMVVVWIGSVIYTAYYDLIGRRENFEEISSKLKSIPLWKQNNVLNRELYTFSGKAIDYQSNEEVERILLTTFLEHKEDFLNDFISSNHILCESNKILYTLNTIIEKQPNIIELYNLF